METGVGSHSLLESFWIQELNPGSHIAVILLPLSHQGTLTSIRDTDFFVYVEKEEEDNPLNYLCFVVQSHSVHV